jgi:hypothetical protein
MAQIKINPGKLNNRDVDQCTSFALGEGKDQRIEIKNLRLA